MKYIIECHNPNNPYRYNVWKSICWDKWTEENGEITPAKTSDVKVFSTNDVMELAQWLESREKIPL
jgi:hypothetical protein